MNMVVRSLRCEVEDSARSMLLCSKPTLGLQFVAGHQIILENVELVRVDHVSSLERELQHHRIDRNDKRSKTNKRGKDWLGVKQTE